MSKGVTVGSLGTQRLTDTAQPVWGSQAVTGAFTADTGGLTLDVSIATHVLWSVQFSVLGTLTQLLMRVGFQNVASSPVQYVQVETPPIVGGGVALIEMMEGRWEFSGLAGTPTFSFVTQAYPQLMLIELADSAGVGDPASRAVVYATRLVR